MTITNDETRWLYTALKEVEFLKFCSLGEIEQLIQNLTKRSFKKGDIIVKEGDRGDYLFLLYSGEVSIRAKSGFLKQKEITRLGPGRYFGEMALVSFEPRSATVTATRDTDAFLLFATDFRKLIEQNDDLARNVENMIARRKADRERELQEQYRNAGRGFLRRLFGL